MRACLLVQLLLSGVSADEHLEGTIADPELLMEVSQPCTTGQTLMEGRRHCRAAALSYAHTALLSGCQQHVQAREGHAAAAICL